MIHWSLEIRQISSLQSFFKNPRQCSVDEKKRLSDSIDRFGMIDKIIVNKTGTVIGGHQRLEILRERGAQTVECWVPDRILTNEEVEELNIRLNHACSWDFDILANDFEITDLYNWGFSEEELGLARPEKKEKRKKPKIILEFSDRDTMIDYIQRVEEIAKEGGAKIKIQG